MSAKKVGKVKQYKTFDCFYHFICCQSLDDLSDFQKFELRYTQKFLKAGLLLKRSWFSWSLFTNHEWN